VVALADGRAGGDQRLARGDPQRLLGGDGAESPTCTAERSWKIADISVCP
jgi:hypothetical protein